MVVGKRKPEIKVFVCVQWDEDRVKLSVKIDRNCQTDQSSDKLRDRIAAVKKRVREEKFD